MALEREVNLPAAITYASLPIDSAERFVLEGLFEQWLWAAPVFVFRESNLEEASVWQNHSGTLTDRSLYSLFDLQS